MIIVTGGSGFIGSNIVKGLNARGRSDIILVDDLSEGKKFVNMVDCEIHDYLDKERFIAMIDNGYQFPEPIDAIFHEGACSDTTEWDGHFMMENNYEYSKALLHYSLDTNIQFIYASSAAIYGAGSMFSIVREHESPLNVYGYSKFLFDQYVQRFLKDANSQVTGLRYFNVYGPKEQHKGAMSSVAFHFNNQIKENGKLKLFAGCDGYADGEQRRDFVYIDDIVAVNLWLFDHPDVSGIFNVGTGRSQTFNDVANAVIAWHGKGEIEYIPFPNHLKGHYQSFTQADISDLRAAGYDHDFATVEEGVKRYLDILNKN